MKPHLGCVELKVKYYCGEYHNCTRNHVCKSDEPLLTTYDKLIFEEGLGWIVKEFQSEFYICPHLIIEGKVGD